MKAQTSFLISRLLPVLVLAAAGNLSVSAAPIAAYPQPQPSSQEQYLLELINAARANPAAEGRLLAGVTDSEILRYYDHYNISTSQMISQFDSYAAQPPLAFNADLMASSREQSQYQASSGIQTHNSADGTTFDQRISAEGYKWSAVGENVYAYAENPFFAHVGLMADWGVPTLDHRENLLNTNASLPVYREIGISAVSSSIANFGPLVVTEDFGTPADSTVAYLVGVIYQDANGNGSYDEGEGLPGVTVTPDGTNYYAVSTSTGGFVIPLPTSGSGTLTVTATGGALGGRRVKTVAYTAGTNVKVDFTTADPISIAPTLPVVTFATPPTVALVSGQTGNIQITRAGDLSQPLSVSLVYSGSAVSGVDYMALPSTVTLPAGASGVTLKVHATSAVSGGDKKLKVHFGQSAGYSISSDKAKTQTKIKILTQ